MTQVVWTMRRLEGGHVAVQSTLMLKIPRKALDRHVGDREQMGETDAMALPQGLSVLLL